MSSRSGAPGQLGALAAILLALSLAGCTGLTPVYGDHASTGGGVAVQVDVPTNRLERIIYQDLALKLIRDKSGSAPKLTISASQKSGDLTNKTVSSPMTQRQMVVTALVVLVDASGSVLYTGSLAQTADYTVGPQALANQQAEADASANAARLLADTIRLRVLATLAR